MIISELSKRVPKETDYLVIETEGEPTARTQLTASNLGFAPASKITELEGKITQLEKKLEGEITAAIAGAFVAKGSVPYEELPDPTEANVGDTYNVKDQFTADEKIVDSESGHTFPAGTNVVCVEKEGVKKFDPMAGFIDTSKLATVEALNTLQSTVTTNGQTLTELKGKVEDPETGLAATKTAADAAKSTAEAAQSTATEVQTKVDDPDNGIEKVQEGLTALKSAVEDESTGLTATKAIADAAKSTADTVSSAVNNEATGLAATKKIADDAKTAATNLKTDVETNYIKVVKASA